MNRFEKLEDLLWRNIEWLDRRDAQELADEIALNNPEAEVVCEKDRDDVDSHDGWFIEIHFKNFEDEYYFIVRES